MRVVIDYSAQIKRMAGCDREEIDVDAGSTAQDVISLLARERSDTLARFLMGEDGRLRATVLAFLNDEQVRWEVALGVKDGDELVFMSAIAGGTKA